MPTDIENDARLKRLAEETLQKEQEKPQAEPDDGEPSSDIDIDDLFH